MAKKSDPKDKPSKTFDVSKPGETPAGATSRPIIVGHAPMIKKDPMVRDSDDEQSEKPEDAKPPAQTHQIKIEPLSKKEEDKEPEASTPETKDEPAEEKAEEPKDSKPTGSDKTDTEQKSEDKPEDAKPEGGAVEALAGEVTAKREEQKKKEEAEAKAKELEKVIESKEFFVPIGQAARRRSALRLILVLIALIVLAAVILNFAVDAKVLDIGVEPLTDLL